MPEILNRDLDLPASHAVNLSLDMPPESPPGMSKEESSSVMLIEEASAMLTVS